ncbi:7TM-DISM domain-containing protein [Halodesulfovibrio spirochaetisodalis]|uniref:Uncharacterized protein n=1 Tax=Halodesulfovibrio spirochaetisodalis TaxID=1560234 RepID=A0A1B7XF01_9BACT|nr:7TM-DISM domain-containing protein [Halodesulfovibrio spirochaetisodalis]OBQ52742.1 hypothetical protein SP90_07245 [Halodesulfovibrio spirochaetisodalis]
MLPTISRPSRTCIFIALCCFFIALPRPSYSNSISTGNSASVAYDVFFEKAPTAGILEVSAPQFRQVFTPLAQTPIPQTVKRVWIRISIPAAHLERWRMNGFFPFIELGGKVLRPTTLFYRPTKDSLRWQSSNVSQPQLPLPVSSSQVLTEYYLKIDGKPDLWFHPEVTLQSTPMPLYPAPVLFWIILGLALGITVLNIYFAVTARKERFLLLSIYSIFATAYYAFATLPSAAIGLEFSTSWTILLPGLAIIILPHIGRTLLYNSDCPKQLDRLLWGISLIGACLAITPLIPGLTVATYYLPLWPAVAVLPLIAGIAAMLQKRQGSIHFIAACSIAACGTFLALLPASSANTASILQLPPFAGIVIGLLSLTAQALRSTKPLTTVDSATQPSGHLTNTQPQLAIEEQPPTDIVMSTEDLPQLLIIETRSAPSEYICERLDIDAFNIHTVTSSAEASTIYEEHDVDALIVAAELTEDAINILSKLATIDAKHSSPSTPAIALANSPVSAELLYDAGYAKALPVPVSQDDLLAALAELGLYTLPISLTESMVAEENMQEEDAPAHIAPLSLSGLDVEPVEHPEEIEKADEEINTTAEAIIDTHPAPDEPASFTNSVGHAEPDSSVTLNEEDYSATLLSEEHLSSESDSDESQSHDESTPESENDLPSHKEENLDEREPELADQYAITPQQEEFLDRIIASAPSMEPEELSADATAKEPADAAPEQEKEHRTTAAPTLDLLEGIDPDEDKNAIFERIAQERRSQEAAYRTASDNYSALSSTLGESSANIVQQDTSLTEAVQHLTVKTEEFAHPAEALNQLLLPQIPKIISQLQEAFEEIAVQVEKNSTSGILATATKLQQQAHQYALREIEKMASCVERAATAQDHQAISTLMPELESTVVQTGKALRDIYKKSTAEDEGLI